MAILDLVDAPSGGVKAGFEFKDRNEKFLKVYQKYRNDKKDMSFFFKNDFQLYDDGCVYLGGFYLTVSTGHCSQLGGDRPIVLVSPYSVDIDKLRAECAKSEEGVVEFLLKNGEPAYTGILNVRGIDYVGLVIPNAIGKFNLPFSFKNNNKYNRACLENGTLPFMVENDLFLPYIPDHIQKLMGIDLDFYKTLDTKKWSMWRESEKYKEIEESLDALKEIPAGWFVKEKYNQNMKEAVRKNLINYFNLNKYDPNIESLVKDKTTFVKSIWKSKAEEYKTLTNTTEKTIYKTEQCSQKSKIEETKRNINYFVADLGRED